MSLRKVATMTAGIVLGNVIAERFILQAGPDDPTGFIPVSAGIGLDEVVRGVAGVAATMLVDNITRKVL